LFSLNISSLATVYVQVPVSAVVNAQVYNPTADVVKMAFMQADTKPQTSDWKTGGWDTAPGPTYLAQCLVGPNGGVSLAVGVYTVWVQITDNPEQPTQSVGTLTVE
jgi:hypothetical protein